MVINSDFRAVESQVFHLDMQSACVPLFASDPSGALFSWAAPCASTPTRLVAHHEHLRCLPSALGVDRNRTLQLIADRLVSVCVSMNEFP